MIENYSFRYWHTITGGQYEVLMSAQPGKDSFFLNYKDEEKQIITVFFSLADAKELYYTLEAMLTEARGVGWQRREPHG